MSGGGRRLTFSVTSIETDGSPEVMEKHLNRLEMPPWGVYAILPDSSRPGLRFQIVRAKPRRQGLDNKASTEGEKTQ